jgi:hypothetical protein
MARVINNRLHTAAEIQEMTLEWGEQIVASDTGALYIADENGVPQEYLAAAVAEIIDEINEVLGGGY